MSSEQIEGQLPVPHPEALARTLLLAAARVLESDGQLQGISFLWLRSRLISHHPRTPDIHVR